MLQVTVLEAFVALLKVPNITQNTEIKCKLNCLNTETCKWAKKGVVSLPIHLSLYPPWHACHISEFKFFHRELH